jgi:hypothetical protein
VEGEKKILVKVMVQKKTQCYTPSWFPLIMTAWDLLLRKIEGPSLQDIESVIRAQHHQQWSDWLCVRASEYTSLTLGHNVGLIGMMILTFQG